MFSKINSIPFLFQEFKDEKFLDSLYKISLDKEKEILKLPLTWNKNTKKNLQNPTTARFGSYNFLNFESPSIVKLRTLIENACSLMTEFQYGTKFLETEQLWIQCWVNIHRKGSFLQRHYHSDYLMFGHFIVHSEGTYTIYGGNEEVHILNEPGQLTVIGQDKVYHRVTPYNGEREARVSVAFDILRGERGRKVSASRERVVIPFLRSK